MVTRIAAGYKGYTIKDKFPNVFIFGCRVTRIAVGYKGYIFRQDFEQGLFRLQGYMGCSRLQG